MSKIRIAKGDITRFEVDAIVNAANKTLLGGGGVDGAIHKAAGVKLMAECAALGGCKTGEAKITGGYDLPCKYVIHTVGPVYDASKEGQDKLLANCYANSLKLAECYKLRSVAFSAVSTGVYGYPIEEACKIAYDTVKTYLKQPTTIETVIFVCFNDAVYAAFKKLTGQY